jgi:ABC-2 type transport system ATP-binding protein
MSIVVEDVNKYYGQQKALNGVSFSVNEGEIIGFIGPNGAGKSTMMKIITGFLPASSGKVKVAGYNIAENSLETRKRIGYLPENNPLYLNMYVKEYLGFIAGMYKVKKKKSRIEEIITSTGLTPEQDKIIGNLSKGYRQRVGLAQALLHDPGVLILDEPTSGLDPNQIIEIRNLIAESGKNKTVMLSTHIMQEVEAICDRIIIINNGDIVADEKTANIYDKTGKQKVTILVEFNKPVDKNLLMDIPGVVDAVKSRENTWLVESPKNIDIREEIFKFAVKNDISVLSQQKKENNLEEVFHELTRQNKNK